MPLRSIFVEHLWLKVFSIILATLIWLTIRANLERETREETRPFDKQPVALLSDSGERRALVLDPAQVSVAVKGPKTVIDNLRESDIHAYVELSSHAGNTGNYNVEVHAPAGVTVVLVTPRSVFVRQAGEGQ